MSLLVLDIGSSNVRACTVEHDGSIDNVLAVPFAPLRPTTGIVEFDPIALAKCCTKVANQVIASAGGSVDAIGISAQRASTIVFDNRTGIPVGPGLSWQDQRTAGQCLSLASQGIRLAPNQSATKVTYLLGLADKNDRSHLRFSTIESWIAYVLSNGATHVTDATNAGVTGLLALDGSGWDGTVLEHLAIPHEMLPEIVDSTGVVGVASALTCPAPIAALIGDQQASLIGQGRLLPGETKVTFGTGGMLDCNLGSQRPAFDLRGPAGSFPIIARRDATGLSWGLETIMLSAGSCLDWLCTQIGLIATPAESSVVASSVRDSGGVFFVPALSGIGSPVWDFGARGLLSGLDHTTSRAQIVRAVLEGIAQRTVDLLEAAELDSGLAVDVLHVDGGMSANPTFVQLVADAISRPVAVSAVREATAVGAAFLAGVGIGTWPSLLEAASTIAPPEVIEPSRGLDRERWLAARDHALGAVPALSLLKF